MDITRDEHDQLIDEALQMERRIVVSGQASFEELRESMEKRFGTKLVYDLDSRSLSSYHSLLSDFGARGEMRCKSCGQRVRR